MTHVSPHSRSATERSRHQNATAIFIAVAAAVLFSVLWFVDPNVRAWLSRTTEPDDVIHTKTKEPALESRGAITPRQVDWTIQLDAIEKRLTNASSATLTPHLQSLRNSLKSVHLSEQETLNVHDSLAKLEHQLLGSKEQSDPTSTDVLTFERHLDSVEQSIRSDEHEEVRKARDFAEQKVRATHEEKEPSIRDIRLSTRDNQDRAATLRRQIAKLQREQKEFQAKAARAAALQRDLADVERYLKPFTAPGYLQPKSDRNAWDTERTVDAKPVSLARLKRLGALDDTMEGLERLYIFGGGKNPVLNNSRPLGSFPQYWAQHLGKPEVQNAVQRAQELLREHGQALVEEQRLSP